MSIIVKVQFTAGSEFEQALTEAIRLAEQLNTLVEFSFNGVNMQVAGCSDFDKALLHYEHKLKEK